MFKGNNFRDYQEKEAAYMRLMDKRPISYMHLYNNQYIKIRSILIKVVETYVIGYDNQRYPIREDSWFLMFDNQEEADLFMGI